LDRDCEFAEPLFWVGVPCGGLVKWSTWLSELRVERAPIRCDNTLLSGPITGRQGNTLARRALGATELATDFTDVDYQAACKADDRKKIADAICRRFKERYIRPVTPLKGTIMAVSCLMIESLESFRLGLPKTNGKSKAMFHEFFESETSPPEFKDFKGYGDSFYQNVRCGILHQAETTGGWKITRKEATPLFNDRSLTINAALFLRHLRAVLDGFCNRLKSVDSDSTDWENVRTNMSALCNNCRTMQA
jgi:hypothetical protein